MATQNPQVDGSAVSTSPQQNIGQRQGWQQQPRNPTIVIINPINPMMMYHDEDRSRARCVAICDLVIAGIYLKLLLVNLVLLIFLLITVHTLRASGEVKTVKKSTEEFKPSEPAKDPTEGNFLLVHFLLTTFMTIIQVIAAVGLLRSTRSMPAPAPDKAYRNANCWRVCSILFLFYDVNVGMLCIASGQRVEPIRTFVFIGVIYLVIFVVRLLFVILANSFIERLEKVASIVPISTTTSMPNINNRNLQQQP